MDDLIAFLNTRLDEDEQRAQACGPVPWVNGAFGVEVDPAAIRDNKLAYGHLGYVAGADPGELGDAYRAHIARHNPARVLADVAAKRQIIDRYERARAAPGSTASSYQRGQDNGYREALLDTIRDFARLHAGHPDYREEWRP